jgi:dihydropyrimidinase
MTFDTIIRGGTAATASDTFACDVGISGGRIAALGHDLGDATQTIDATGRLSSNVKLPIAPSPSPS